MGSVTIPKNNVWAKCIFTASTKLVIPNVIYLCNFSTSGSILIDSAGTYNGTNVSVSIESGIIGNCGVYNGSTAYTAMPASWSNFLSSNFSIAFWVYSNGTSGTLLSFLYGSYSDIKQSGTSIIFNMNNDNKLSGAISTFAWSHVGFTRSLTAGLKMYINGILVSTNSYTGTDAGISLTYENAIGRFRVALPRAWSGKLCQIVVSTDIWLQDIFSSLYNNGHGKEIAIAE